MKKIIFSICALSLMTTVYAQKLDRSIKPKAGPAPEINLSDAKSFTLDNGLKVFVVENHKLPVVTYSIDLDIRPALQGDKVGMEDFVGQLLTSGTKNKTKDQFDTEVDEIGAVIRGSSDGMYGQSLIKHQEKLLSLMSDALINANFQASELEKLKKQSISALATSENEPDAMLQNISKVINFGKNHPYGEVESEKTISNITLADCNNYYNTYFRPNVAYMAVVGDITLAQAKELVTKHFGKWQSANVPKAKYPTVTAPTKTTVNYSSRAGAVQSVIGITYPINLQPGDPDVVKVRVMNEIIGGSSQGRLFLNLRESKAWTYGSYSSFSDDDIIGKANFYAKARNIVTDSSVTEILYEMNRIRDEKVSKEDLQSMLNYMSGKFAIGLENPQTIARFAINIDKYNLPKDYYKNYLKNVNAVTVDDVQAMAKKYVHPDKANIIVVGNPSEAEKLKKFSADGEVNFFDSYGNPVQKVETKVVDGVTAKDVLNKYINAIGGTAAIESVKNLSISAIGSQMGQEFNVDIKMMSPDKFKQSIIAGGQEFIKIVVNGDKGYMSQMGNKKDMDADQVAQYKEQADIQAILTPEKYGTSYNLNGIEDLDGVEVYNVEKISNNGKDRTVQYYEVKSGLLVQEISNVKMQGQEVVSIKKLSNYKEVKGGNGYKMAFNTETLGQMAAKITIQSAKANTKMKDGDFK